MKTPATIIKICGITTAQNAQLAIEAGATWLGLIFVPNTPRTVITTELQAITKLARKAEVHLVGVFQNQQIDLINSIAESLQLQNIQLHGDETPEDCQRCLKPVIKVFPLEPFPTAEEILPYQRFIDYVLLDLPKGYPTLPNWETYPIDALQKAIDLPVLLAGKLTAETVGAVVAQHHPAGVDVASGVETTVAGEKSAEKLTPFVESINRIKAPKG
jgi:phosphoribosylanthranilate isomerase